MFNYAVNSHNWEGCWLVAVSECMGVPKIWSGEFLFCFCLGLKITSPGANVLRVPVHPDVVKLKLTFI